jgi:multidrug efflux pump
MTITIMGGFLVATVLTLPVVPPLYEMWFRVRIDETL